LTQEFKNDSRGLGVRLGLLSPRVITDSEFFVAKALDWALRDYSVSSPG